MTSSQSMSAHDRAAANHARQRFTLCVTRAHRWGGLNQREFHNLTAAEVEAEKSYQRECWPAPGYELSFDVERE